VSFLKCGASRYCDLRSPRRWLNGRDPNFTLIHLRPPQKEYEIRANLLIDILQRRTRRSQEQLSHSRAPVEVNSNNAHGDSDSVVQSSEICVAGKPRHGSADLRPTTLQPSSERLVVWKRILVRLLDKIYNRIEAPSRFDRPPPDNWSRAAKGWFWCGD
jgi:hypothetical protein